MGGASMVDSCGLEPTTLPSGRMGNLTVAVIGLGAIGNEVVKNLALARTGHLIVIDPDTVCQRNLARSVLFRQGDLGRRKAEVIASVLRSRYPDTRVTEY